MIADEVDFLTLFFSQMRELSVIFDKPESQN